MCSIRQQSFKTVASEAKKGCVLIQPLIIFIKLFYNRRNPDPFTSTDKSVFEPTERFKRLRSVAEVAVNLLFKEILPSLSLSEKEAKFNS